MDQRVIMDDEWPPAAAALERLVRTVLAGANQPPERATTLPPAAYSMPPFFQLEAERILRTGWLAIAHHSQLTRVGDYITVDLLGEMLVVVRAADRLRVLSRVCLHRWAPVVQGRGNTKLFSCPFHKWGYGLDGRLIGAPLMHKVDFEAHSHCLPEYRSEIVDGFIYVNLSGDAAPLAPQLRDLSMALANLRPHDWVIGTTLEYELAVNWKIVVETFMECYHHMGAHPQTFEPNYPARATYVDASHAAWSACHAPARADLPESEISAGFPELGETTLEQRRRFSVYLVYPCQLLYVHSDRITWFSLQPEGVMSTRLQTHILVRQDALALPDYEAKLAAERAFLGSFNDEDMAVNLLQQRGAATRAAAPGRLSHLERAVWAFAEYLRAHLGAQASPPP